MLLAGPISHTSTQHIDFVGFLHFTGVVNHLFYSFWWLFDQGDVEKGMFS